MQWFYSDVEIDTGDVVEMCRVRCGLRIDLHAGDRMSFREQQKKELVAQETDNHIQDGKSLAQKTDGYVKLRVEAEWAAILETWHLFNHAPTTVHS